MFSDRMALKTLPEKVLNSQAERASSCETHTSFTAAICSSVKSPGLLISSISAPSSSFPRHGMTIPHASLSGLDSNLKHPSISTLYRLRQASQRTDHRGAFHTGLSNVPALPRAVLSLLLSPVFDVPTKPLTSCTLHFVPCRPLKFPHGRHQRLMWSWFSNFVITIPLTLESTSEMYGVYISRYVPCILAAFVLLDPRLCLYLLVLELQVFDPVHSFVSFQRD